jgi:hypothetical protein
MKIYINESIRLNPIDKKWLQATNLVLKCLPWTNCDSEKVVEEQRDKPITILSGQIKARTGTPSAWGSPMAAGVKQLHVQRCRRSSSAMLGAGRRGKDGRPTATPTQRHPDSHSWFPQHRRRLIHFERPRPMATIYRVCLQIADGVFVQFLGLVCLRFNLCAVTW